MSPLRVCMEPGCPVLVPANSPGRGRCPAHASQHEKGYRQRYDASTLYDRRWQRARRAFLAAHPLCVDCTAEGVTAAATEVDHVIRHNGDRALFWDKSNWAPRCKPHHSRKTAQEVGWTARGTK